MPASLRLLTVAILLAALACVPASAGAATLVVRFKHSASAGDRARAARGAGIDPASDRRGPGGARLLSSAAPSSALRALRAQRAVAWASRDLPARLSAVAATPNDTGIARKTGPPGGWQAAQWDLVGPASINVGPAWQLARTARAAGGRTIRVAVLDTGVAYADRGRYRRSPDLPGARIVRGWDFVGDDPYPNDQNGHGTFVASTIAAAANNGYGMIGIAYAAEIMPVRVLDSSGEGSSARIAEGLRWAVNHGARVVNMSIELYDPLALRALSITTAPEVRSALRYARNRNVIVVAAAGNAGQANVPSRRLDDAIIYVGGTTEHGCLGVYSNHGPGMDVVAPGGGDDAAVPGDVACKPDAPPGRNVMQVTFARARPGRFIVPTSYKGTSMAAPHVTGTIALMLGAKVIGRNPTPRAVQRRLDDSARDLGTPGKDAWYRSGLLDAGRALAGTTIATPSAG